MRRFIIFALLAAVLPLGAFEVKQSKVDNVLMTRVDSPWFKITVNPLGAAAPKMSGTWRNPASFCGTNPLLFPLKSSPTGWW